jgi:hypothetical protein
MPVTAFVQHVFVYLRKLGISSKPAASLFTARGLRYRTRPGCRLSQSDDGEEG